MDKNRYSVPTEYAYLKIRAVLMVLLQQMIADDNPFKRKNEKIIKIQTVND
jgi:hypothetical protein